MKKSSYRKYFIYSEAKRNEKGTFDQRVILQKIGTSKISAHHPSGASASENEAENRGTGSGEKIVNALSDEHSQEQR